ncbi:hypothetical protein F8388_007140 [Cannabis sativa]|uniref:Uncharacterized protein n=1 Tax=Cannabis sativa TaxID=3483 RepID=A0A7J6EGY8_CANSA|nr:hypothetical protein F8388_007140 [Cannabis sativa]
MERLPSLSAQMRDLRFAYISAQMHGQISVMVVESDHKIKLDACKNKGALLTLAEFVISQQLFSTSQGTKFSSSLLLDFAL